MFRRWLFRRLPRSRRNGACRQRRAWVGQALSVRQADVGAHLRSREQTSVVLRLLEDPFRGEPAPGGSRRGCVLLRRGDRELRGVRRRGRLSLRNSECVLQGRRLLPAPTRRAIAGSGQALMGERGRMYLGRWPYGSASGRSFDRERMLVLLRSYELFHSLGCHGWHSRRRVQNRRQRLE